MTITERYVSQFKQLQEAGVPDWFLLEEATLDLIHFQTVYIYENPNAGNGYRRWYTMNAIGITARKSEVRLVGRLNNFGQIPWGAYKELTAYGAEVTRDDYDLYQELYRDSQTPFREYA